MSNCKKCEALQAKIDALMFEYCPDDMTAAQLIEWASRQRKVNKETQELIDAAIAREAK